MRSTGKLPVNDSTAGPVKLTATISRWTDEEKGEEGEDVADAVAALCVDSICFILHVTFSCPPLTLRSTLSSRSPFVACPPPSVCSRRDSTLAAQALRPLPQDHVSPQPRSNVRTDNEKTGAEAVEEEAEEEEEEEAKEEEEEGREVEEEEEVRAAAERDEDGECDGCSCIETVVVVVCCLFLFISLYFFAL